MKRDGIFVDFNNGTIRLDESAAAQDIIRQCAASPDG